MVRVVTFVSLVLVLVAGNAYAHGCTGDCDGSDTVSINELVNGVRIALDEVTLDTCFAFDPSADGRVSIDELQVAVNNAFSYCGHGSPPTPRDTPTGARTPTATPGQPG